MNTGKKSLLIETVFLWVLVIGLSLTVNVLTGQGNRAALVCGALLNASVFLVLTQSGPIVQWLRQVPTPHKIILFSLIFCTLTGHFLGLSHATFPFMKWYMYTTVRETSKFYYTEYWGILEDGRRVRLNPDQLFPPLKNGAINRLLETPLDRLVPELLMEPHKTLRSLRGRVSELSLEQQKTRLEATMRAVGLRYNELHPTARLRAVETDICVMDAEESLKTPPACHMAWHVDMKTGDTR